MSITDRLRNAETRTNRLRDTIDGIDLSALAPDEAVTFRRLYAKCRGTVPKPSVIDYDQLRDDLIELARGGDLA
jgi:hypothetical protein